MDLRRGRPDLGYRRARNAEAPKVFEGLLLLRRDKSDCSASVEEGFNGLHKFRRSEILSRFKSLVGKGGHEKLANEGVNGGLGRD